jgi:hypothetical protein
MKFSLFFIFITILSLPNFVYAEPVYLECTIKFRDFVDDYSVSLDLETGSVISSYHAASDSKKDVVIDYTFKTDALLSQDKVIYKIKKDSLDWIFTIDRKTLVILRQVADSGGEDIGQGTCKIIGVDGKKTELL